MATMGATRLHRAGRSIPERLRLQCHGAANGRQSAATLRNVGYRLPHRCVVADMSGVRDLGARTFPDLSAQVSALPEVASA